MNKPHERNFGLDLIRATAIGLVVISHYSTVAPVCGVLGVELFFVLSGFLIGGILYKIILFQEKPGFQDVFRFWVRRWLRTLPNYYLFLLIVIILPFFVTSSSGRGFIWRDLLFLWRYLLFLQNFAWPPSLFYVVSWSLAVEEWFYLLFPLSFLLVYTFAGKQQETKRRIFLLIVAIFLLLSLVLRLCDSNNWSMIDLHTIVIYRFDALMFGVILAVIKIESNALWKWLQRLLPVGCVLLAAGTFITQRALPSAPPILPAAWIFTLIPLSFALVLPKMTSLAPPWIGWVQAIRYVSKCSYSIYLCHLPILQLFIQGAHDSQLGLLGKVLVRTSSLVITLVCSGLLYYYFEKPVLDLAPAGKFSSFRGQPNK